MLRPAAQRLKNKHVERALEQLDPTLIAFPFSHGSRYSTPKGSSLSTGWLKAGSVRVPKQIPRVTHTPGTHRAGSTFIDIRWTERDRSSLTPTRHQCRLPLPLPLHPRIPRQHTPPEIPQQIQPQSVRAVGECLLGAIVNLHEHAVDSHRYRRPRQRSDELRLPRTQQWPR